MNMKRTERPKLTELKGITEQKTPISPLRAAIFLLLQLTWGLPQTLAGFLVFLKNRKEPHELHRYAIHTTWTERLSGVSLGLFIFTGEDCTRDTKDHEFGHCLQSLILGPLYLPVIGIPSLLWNRTWRRNLKRNGRARNYFTFYTERWAEFHKRALTARDEKRKETGENQT